MQVSDRNISLLVRQKAEELGFMECRIVPAGYLHEEERRLANWLGNRMHGEMGYMERNVDKRLDPSLLVENAKTIVLVLQNYFQEEYLSEPGTPVVSKYARGTDYHFVMKKKLHELLGFIRSRISNCGGRPFVDSAPVLERAWARRAGLGWIGKNSNLISPDHGSFFFIGELILDREMAYDKVTEVHDRCGTCTRCIDACPTRAITAPKVLDARRCISYQTIELKGDLDEILKGKFRNRVFGCDICQDVCPWNLKPEPHREPDLGPREKLMEMKKADWHNMTEASFGEIFRNSAVMRTGYQGLMRNLRFIGGDDNGKSV